MQPEETGRFCSSCSKTVVDFSNKTDAEIRDLLLEQRHQKVCGHFKKTQLNRPLELMVDPGLLPRNISGTRAFAIAVFLVFGSMLFSCTTQNDEVIGKIGMVMLIDSTEQTPEQLLKGDTVIFTGPGPIGEIYVSGDIEVAQQVIHRPDPSLEDSAMVPLLPEPYVAGMISPDIVMPDSSSLQQTDTPNIRGNLEKNSPAIEEQQGLLIYPNPGRGEFILRYNLSKRSNVRIDLLDLEGRLISTPVNIAAQYEGRYNIPVNMDDLPNGVYVVALTKNEKRFTEKVILKK